MPPSSDDDDDHHGRELYSIPKSSSWFLWDEIHETERQSLPEFFDGTSASRNPRIYKEYRDFIINKYREDPSRRLTFTEVRKSLIGDVGFLQKVFLFLDQCGLINFGAPPKVTEQVAGTVVDDGRVKVVVEEGLPSGVEVVPAFVPRRKRTAAIGGVGGESGFKLPPLTSYSDVFGDLDLKRGTICSLCGKQGLSSGEVKLLKTGLPICSTCSEDKGQTDGKVGEDSTNKADDVANHVTSVWTDAETLLLLEAVLKHGDDWDFIAQHVQTKSKIDCIARLIHLPFGEHLLGTLNGTFDSKSLTSQEISQEINQEIDVKKDSSEPQEDPEKTNGHEAEENVAEEAFSGPPSKKRCLPTISDAAGSLMKQVANLSKVAGPDVASAAAESAITTLCNENPYARRVFDIDEEKSKMLSTTNKCISKVKNEDSANNQNEKDSSDAREDKIFGARTFQIRAAVATAFGAAAARAKLLADQEEREMELLMASIVEAQIRKLQYKIKHFDELEVIMESEFKLMQKTKENILEEWTGSLEQALQAGNPKWKDHVPSKSFINTNNM